MIETKDLEIFRITFTNRSGPGLAADFISISDRLARSCSSCGVVAYPSSPANGVQGLLLIVRQPDFMSLRILRRQVCLQSIARLD